MILDVEIDYQAFVKYLKQPSANDLFGNTTSSEDTKEKTISFPGSDSNQISLFESFD